MKNILRFLFAGFCLFTTANPLHAQWTQTGGPEGGWVLSIASDAQGYLYAGSGSDARQGGWINDGGGPLYRSSDYGESWVQAYYLETLSLLEAGNQTMIAGTRIGIYRSSDHGNSWTRSPGTQGFTFYRLVMDSIGNVYATTSPGGVFRSSDSGASWIRRDSGITATSEYDLAITPKGTLIVSAFPGAIFRSTNAGLSWSLASGSPPVPRPLLSITTGPATGTVLVGWQHGIYRSTDDGVTWSSIVSITNQYAECFAIDSSGALLAGTHNGVLRSTDNGLHWSPSGLNSLFIYVLYVSPYTKAVLAATTAGVFLSTDNGITWSPKNHGVKLVRIVSLAPTSQGTILAGTWGGGVYRSSDRGTTWEQKTEGLSGSTFKALTLTSAGLVLAGSSSGIFSSTDDGEHWQENNAGLPTYRSAYALAASSTTGHLFCAIYSHGIYRSTDNGSNWIGAGTSSVVQTTVQSLAVSSRGILFAGTSDSGVFRSTDEGITWIKRNVGLKSKRITALAIDSSGYCYAGTYGGGVSRSTDNGDHWDSLAFRYIRSITVNTLGHVFVAPYGLRVYRSTDHGQSWTSFAGGLVSSDFSVLATGTSGPLDGYLLAGTVKGEGVYLSQNSTTAVDAHELAAIPAHLELGVNYPNPFNPTTTISFSLPSKLFVLLKIFDLIGREVTTIVSGELSAGTHTREWNAANMPSGIYFYRLQAGTFSETKKLVLLR